MFFIFFSLVILILSFFPPHILLSSALTFSSCFKIWQKFTLPSKQFTSVGKCFIIGQLCCIWHLFIFKEAWVVHFPWNQNKNTCMACHPVPHTEAITPRKALLFCISSHWVYNLKQYFKPQGKLSSILYLKDMYSI